MKSLIILPPLLSLLPVLAVSTSVSHSGAIFSSALSPSIKTGGGITTHIRDYASLADPLIGTDFTGNTYPGPQAPFGMVQLSPDNGQPGWDYIAGYFYPDSTIAGFSHTHLSGTGAGDLYDISYFPYIEPGVKAALPLGLHSRFSHDREEARAGYYKVRLDDYGIDAELTATPRVGLQRYTFPASDSAAIALNLSKATNWDATRETDIIIIDSLTVAGHRFSDGWARGQKVWFVSRFSRPFESVSIDSVDVYGADSVLLTKACDATFRFHTSDGEQITIATALSPTGIEGAMSNLLAEAPAADFDKAASETREAWDSALSGIRVTTDNDSLRRIFYTALYHSLLAPTLFCDSDGTYPGPDGQIHKDKKHPNYSSFSTWDTYRAAHPLYTIIQPEKAGDMARSLIAFGRQNGRLPVWNMWAGETDMMIGYHSVPIITDAILKGLGNFSEAEEREALDLMVATARKRDYRQLGDYIDLGYVPVTPDDNWEMSKTLEYAFDDYSIYLLAQRLGEVETAQEFLDRSHNYANTFNPATGFFQPRHADGSFDQNFNPDEYPEEICESNAWQYLFSVQHDIDALTRLLGGRSAFEQRLDSLFSHTTDPSVKLPIFSTGMIGQYAHGNEPSHHVPYLYNHTDSPWKTSDLLRRIMTTLYDDSPAGLPGNEDMGQMSAWFVMSAMGFYPVDPVGGVYELGAPMFEKVEIPVGNDRCFTLIADGLSDTNRYIKSATLDGRPLDGRQITHDDIMRGRTLRLEMTSERAAY